MLISKLPSECVPVALSNDFALIVIRCGAESILKLLEVNSERTVTLFEQVAYSAEFSPNNKQLAIAAENFNGGDAVWLFDVGNWETPRMLRSYSNSFGTELRWAPDGQSLAVSYIEDGYALSILNLDGTIRNLLTYDDVHKINGPGNNLFGPAWTPDGRQIAYVSTDSFMPQPVQLQIVDVLTGEKELIYSGKLGEIGFNPIWSPDGRNIAFGSFLEKSHPIYIFNVKDKTLMAIGNFYLGYSAAWSPNGEYLAVCNQEIYIISTSSGRITNFKEECTNPILAWQGNNRIVFQYKSILYTMPISNYE
jgi:Tol biopolymer transport system component